MITQLEVSLLDIKGLRDILNTYLVFVGPKQMLSFPFTSWIS